MAKATGSAIEKGSSCVYLLNKIVGEPAAYVGSTLNKQNRFKQYVTAKPKRYIENSIKKYGWDAFQKIEIDVNPSCEKELRAWENFYIGLFGTHNKDNVGFGMNIIRNPTISISKDADVAKKISISHTGKRLTDEHKERIRHSTKGKINVGIKRPYLSERNKIIKPALGRTGEKHPMSKKIFCIFDNITFESTQEAADYYGITRQGMRYRIKIQPTNYRYL